MQNATTFLDLLVVGEAAVDVLQDFPVPVRRPGGAFYSALAATAVGLKTAVLAPVGGDASNEFIPEIAKFGVDVSRIHPSPSQCVEYIIRNTNEVLPQVLARRSRRAPGSTQFISNPPGTRGVLIHPIASADILLPLVSPFMRRESLVCIDLQHDIDDLEAIKPFLSDASIVFASRNELLDLTNSKTDMAAIRALGMGRPKTVVVKYGIGGSTIYAAEGGYTRIPAFLSNFRCTIGAGDIYNAIFIASQLRNEAPYQSGIQAAIAASVFSEQASFPDYYLAITQLDFSREEAVRTAISAHPEDTAAVTIYLAGNFLSAPSRQWIDTIASVLQARGFTVFSPYRDAGLLGPRASDGDKADIFARDLEALGRSRILVALLDGNGRGGTTWEMGYAYSKRIPIFALLTDNQTPVSNMVFQACRSINSNPTHLLVDIFEYLAENGKLP